MLSLDEMQGRKVFLPKITRLLGQVRHLPRERRSHSP